MSDTLSYIRMYSILNNPPRIPLELRSIFSMKEEEMYELICIVMDSKRIPVTEKLSKEEISFDYAHIVDAIKFEICVRCFLGVVIVSKNGNITLYDEDGVCCELENQAETFVWFFKNQFDLFGLIEAKR